MVVDVVIDVATVVEVTFNGDTNITTKYFREARVDMRHLCWSGLCHVDA